MKPNKVSPWEGTIHWIADVRSGKSQKGKDWSSVDFVVEYKDEQGNVGHIVFNAFGHELVGKVLAAGKGANVRVMWRPDAREYNGKWFLNLSAYDVTVLDEPVESEDLPADDDTLNF